MKKYVLLAVVALTGCSALTSAVTPAVLGGLSKGEPMLGVDTEIIVGDKQQSVKLGDTMDAPQKFDEVDVSDNGTLVISQETEKGNRDIKTDQYTEGIPFWQAGLGGTLFLFIGLFMPQFVVRKKS